ncbi:hypothetical protein UREG_01403 [Uncinocarpus reesii 1704]|uniref:C2H2-type domain-containing protein n=1 Tax=Uncinocarpus reesii (strain UAMH 1704) TaxID=336963 RepID=C4JHX8_UNCRE|nr:uncharacterized protein UREG_01403 [Uncinocarpus reesii 1704]EEP76554.1 hypothetical protein UREG_01403 [Uncinocarpus reesii 1704]
MSEPQSHPRRRPFNGAALPSLLTSSNHGNGPASHVVAPYKRMLKKGATFHSPTTPSADECDPILYIPSLPRRAPTSSRALEEVIAAGERRVAGILGQVERDLAGIDGKSTRNRPSFPGDDFPVPRGLLHARVADTDPMDIDTAPYDSKFHSSRRLPPVDAKEHRVADSGIGSSILDAPLEKTPASGGVQHPLLSSHRSGSMTMESSKPLMRFGAFKQIERHILAPILGEQSFKPFHPIVETIPQRVRNNNITCLRDLEKILLFVPLNETISKGSYMQYGRFTIHCLHTAVRHLNDRDQCLPADRPYTNGYFLDLVAQVQGYAATIAAARNSRSSRDQKGNNLDYSSGEELVLEGGLSSSGRPAELVRRKKDVAISLQTGEPYVESKPTIPIMKRALSVEAGDDSVMRSMARRKKNEPPLNINKKCDHCDRIFRRPCDLSKHEKTHTRPWKCTEPGCKYSKTGWPTEKERDRHVNDKHCKSPRLFNCRFPPCTYQSKRESNCKQHMEKAHGWVYVRSKNTGKGSDRGSPHTPPSFNPSPTIAPGIPTPISTVACSPYMSPYQPQLEHQLLAIASDDTPNNNTMQLELKDQLQPMLTTFNPGAFGLGDAHDFFGLGDAHDLSNTFGMDFDLYPEIPGNGLVDNASPFAQDFDWQTFLC